MGKKWRIKIFRLALFRIAFHPIPVRNLDVEAICGKCDKERGTVGISEFPIVTIFFR